jgi:hypothetical protein
MKKKKKEEVIDEIVAVVNIQIGDDTFIVPVDNWNKAVEEGRTMPIVLGEELHFFTPEDYQKVKLAISSEIVNKKYVI